MGSLDYLEGLIVESNLPEFLLVGISCNVPDVSKKRLECPLHFGIVVLGSIERRIMHRRETNLKIILQHACRSSKLTLLFCLSDRKQSLMRSAFVAGLIGNALWK